VYDKYYGLKGMPFQLTPDSRFFFGSRGHSRAIAHLTYGLAQGEGFIVITGDVGAGKTTLAERLCAQVDRDTYCVARISTTQISSDDLLRMTISGFGIAAETGDKSVLLRRLEEFLRAQRARGRRALLVIDEIQNLALPALEELRMLSNITDDGHASLQTILLGQPQFRSILASHDLDQLRQRVLASYHLGPLSEDETRAYIEHRLTAVGWTGNPTFRDDAFTEIFRRTEGIPRRINRLCSRVLLYGALEEVGVISRQMVEHTALELAHDLEDGSGSRPPANTSDDWSNQARADLDERVSILEGLVARRERIFQRLLDALASSPEPPR
jgi:general secretion pathway protein A